MRALLLAAFLAGPAAAASVRSVVAVPGHGYTVNAVPAMTLGSGSFKDVLIHPANEDHVVKVFPGRWGINGIQEKRQEVYALRRLEPLGVAPKVIEAGAVSLDGTFTGKPAGYIVQERVRGVDLERPTAASLNETQKLFDILARQGIELVDARKLLKLRQNIMVGTTASGPHQAWLVDPDIRESELSRRELAAFYDGLLKDLSRR